MAVNCTYDLSVRLKKCSGQQHLSISSLIFPLINDKDFVASVIRAKATEAH